MSAALREVPDRGRGVRLQQRHVECAGTDPHVLNGGGLSKKARHHPRASLRTADSTVKSIVQIMSPIEPHYVGDLQRETELNAYGVWRNGALRQNPDIEALRPQKHGLFPRAMLQANWLIRRCQWKANAHQFIQSRRTAEIVAETVGALQIYIRLKGQQRRDFNKTELGLLKSSQIRGDPRQGAQVGDMWLLRRWNRLERRLSRVRKCPPQD